MPSAASAMHSARPAGKGGTPGFIAHWKFPKGLSEDRYVSLSRPRGFSRLLSHGWPDRDIIEGCPPNSTTPAFEEFFETKIVATNVACARYRAAMGWPARVD